MSAAIPFLEGKYHNYVMVCNESKGLMQMSLMLPISWLLVATKLGLHQAL